MRRAGWGVGDQALSSLTNMAVSVAVARQVGPSAFGAFALALTLYALMVGASQALCSEPLLVRASGSDREFRLAAIRASTGTALVLGLVVGALVAVVGALVGGTAGAALVPLGLLLPALLVQDAWRFAFLASARPRNAMLNDAVWAGAQVVTFTVAFATHAGVAGLVAAWGLAATVAAVAGGFQAGSLPAPRRAGAWLVSQRDLAPRFLAEFAARSGARQLTLAVLAATAGLSAVGAVRGAQVLFGPVTVLLVGINLVAVPEAVRLARRSPVAMHRSVRRLAAALATGGLAAALLSLSIPDRVGVALLGETWTAASHVRVAQGLLLAAIGATSGLLVGLRALAAARRSMATRLVMVPMIVVGGVGGALVGGAGGAVLGLAAANWAGAVLLARQLRAAVAEATDTSACAARQMQATPL